MSVGNQVTTREIIAICYLFSYVVHKRTVCIKNGTGWRSFNLCAHRQIGSFKWVFNDQILLISWFLLLPLTYILKICVYIYIVGIISICIKAKSQRADLSFRLHQGHTFSFGTAQHIYVHKHYKAVFRRFAASCYCHTTLKCLLTVILFNMSCSGADLSCCIVSI